MTGVLSFWLSPRTELVTLFAQHVVLVAVSTLAAIAIGVPLGIFAARRPRLSAPVTVFANIVQTVPSLAMFGFLLPVPLIGGVGARAAAFVLILYGLLPIIRTTIAGLNGIDGAIRDAGVAMGMAAGPRAPGDGGGGGSHLRDRPPRQRGCGGALVGRDRRRLEELHRAGHPRRAARAGDRTRHWSGRRSAPESRRHADLRSRAVDRRHRRVRRVHGNRADGDLSSADSVRFARRVRQRA